MTSEHASQFDATGTLHSNKILSQVEPSDKRVQIALSPTRRVIADDAPNDPVLGPVTSQKTDSASSVNLLSLQPIPFQRMILSHTKLGFVTLPGGLKKYS
eukprot:3412301-Amphidinium_carterae.1